MLSNEQRAIIKAYGKSQMTLKSHVVLLDGNYKGDRDREGAEWGYIVASCEEAMMSYRNKVYEVVKWQHPHVIPDWGDLDISEDDLHDYLEKRFPLLVKQPV